MGDDDRCGRVKKDADDDEMVDEKDAGGCG